MRQQSNHRYCPKCGEKERLCYELHPGTALVVCMECNHRGPEVNPRPEIDAEKRAWSAWDIHAIKALDQRIFAMLSASELETLEFYRAQGRKFGVAVSIINKADPSELALARSQSQADEIMKKANSLISVTVQ